MVPISVLGSVQSMQQKAELETRFHTLGDVYSWFTEGFDTADLIEAKALVDELEK